MDSLFSSTGDRDRSFLRLVGHQHLLVVLHFQWSHDEHPSKGSFQEDPDPNSNIHSYIYIYLFIDLFIYIYIFFLKSFP